MNQNGDNNYYNHDYGPGGRNPGMNGPYYQPQPPIPPQPGPPAGGTGGKGGGHFLLGLLAGVLITAMVGCGTYVGVRLYLMVSDKSASTAASAGKDGAGSLTGAETMEKLEALEEVIAEYYYKEEDIDKEKMIDGLYSGLVNSLGDPYSVYYNEEEWQELMQSTEGIYYGIGAYLSLDPATGLARIAGVIAGTPAEEAGLRENDIIYMVDDEQIQGLELTEIVSRVKGEEGTKVHLTIYREGEADYLEIYVTRKKIESPTVEYEMYDNGVGYIKIREFDEVTTDQFTEAMAVVKGSGAKGIILDLRGNPGGSLPVVVDIARADRVYRRQVRGTGRVQL